jgi:hypothetical protein
MVVELDEDERDLVVSCKTELSGSVPVSRLDTIRFRWSKSWASRRQNGSCH